jgi:hypothetical protein
LGLLGLERWNTRFLPGTLRPLITNLRDRVRSVSGRDGQALPRDLKVLAGDVPLPIDLVCLADQSNDELTPSIVTYLMVAANGYFRFDESSAVGVCRSAW